MLTKFCFTFGWWFADKKVALQARNINIGSETMNLERYVSMCMDGYYLRTVDRSRFV